MVKEPRRWKFFRGAPWWLIGGMPLMTGVFELIAGVGQQPKTKGQINLISLAKWELLGGACVFALTGIAYLIVRIKYGPRVP